jgi:hypothetical protein
LGQRVGGGRRAYGGLRTVLGRSRSLQPRIVEGVAPKGWVYGLVHKLLCMGGKRAGGQGRQQRKRKKLFHRSWVGIEQHAKSKAFGNLGNHLR